MTCNEREKVRYVKFDKVGHQLITGIANLTPMQSAAADRTREANDELAGDMLRSRFRETDDETRYNMILDRYERIMDRYSRNLEWPETGARRATEQPELIQQAVAMGEAGAGRLLSDIAANVGDRGDTAAREPASTTPERLRRERPRYMRYSMLLDREDLDNPRLPALPRAAPSSLRRRPPRGPPAPPGYSNTVRIWRCGLRSSLSLSLNGFLV